MIVIDSYEISVLNPWKIEQLNEDKIIIGGDQSTVLTVDDAIKMNSCHKSESDLMIVNLHEDARIAELIRAETTTTLKIWALYHHGNLG